MVKFYDLVYFALQDPQHVHFPVRHVLPRSDLAKWFRISESHGRYLWHGWHGVGPILKPSHPIPISFHLGEIDSVDTSIYLNWIIEYPSLLTCITYRTTAPPNGDAVVLQLLTKYIYHSHYINHWHSWDGDWKLLGQLFGTFLRVCFVTS